MMTWLGMIELGECTGTVADIRAYRSGDDVILTWEGQGGATEYNVWSFRDATQTQAARLPGGGGITGVEACAWPSPAPDTQCADTGIVLGEPDLVFYQVRPFCCGINEGP